MRSSPYVLTILAEDILDIALHIPSDDPVLANQVVDDIETAIEQLARHPHLGHQRPDLTNNALYRFGPCGLT